VLRCTTGCVRCWNWGWNASDWVRLPACLPVSRVWCPQHCGVQNCRALCGCVCSNDACASVRNAVLLRGIHRQLFHSTVHKEYNAALMFSYEVQMRACLYGTLDATNLNSEPVQAGSSSHSCPYTLDQDPGCSGGVGVWGPLTARRFPGPLPSHISLSGWWMARAWCAWGLHHRRVAVAARWEATDHDLA
jgi:hypothetical protein